MGHAAHSSVSATRSGLVTPQIVEVMRGSRSENCSAAAPGGTPCRAQLFHAPDRLQHPFGRLLIDVPPIARALRQRAPRIRRRVQHRNATLGRQGDHRLGVAVHQRIAVVRDHDVEVPVAQQRHHHVDPPRRQPDRRGQALVAHA